MAGERGRGTEGYERELGARSTECRTADEGTKGRLAVAIGETEGEGRQE
jgi:hypothetical protein